MNKMTNIKRKKLIIIAFFIITVLLILVILLGTTSGLIQKKSNVVVYQSNSEKLIEYDKNMMQYGNAIYFLDVDKHSIIKHDMETGDNITIVQNNAINKESSFFIRSNQLIYSADNNTFYCDLEGRKGNRLATGEIVYMNDDIYLEIAHKSSKDELYIISYDKNTYRTVNDSHQIASGKTIKMLKAIGDEIYFSSTNAKGRLSVLEVNIKKSTAKIIAQISNDAGSANTKLVISDLLKDNENYYFTVSEVTFTTNEEDLVGYSYLYKVGTEEGDSDIIAENTGLRLAKHPKNENIILYEQCSGEGASVWQDVEYEETEYRWEDLVYGDVTEHFYIDDTQLYRDDAPFVDLKMDVSGYVVNKVIHVEKGYYFLINDDIEKQIWYYCEEDGTGLKKIVE